MSNIKNGQIPPKPQSSKSFAIKKFLELDNCIENDPLKNALLKISKKIVQPQDSPLKRST